MIVARIRPSSLGFYLPREARVFGNRRWKTQCTGDRPYPKEYDMVGPADQKSNIRRMAFARRRNETPTEKGFRMMKEVVHTWHQDFWTKHNENFSQLKKGFLKGKEKKSDKESADELSLFYKEFLDKNYELHKQYQWAWYKKNIKMVWPGIRISMDRLSKSMFSRVNR